MINYDGLRKRPQFEAIVDYLANGQEKTKYPNRQAKFIRNHPYLTQLDHVGMFEMEEQQENAWKEQEKEHRVKELATKGSQSVPNVSSQGTQSAPEIRTQLRREQGSTSTTQYFDLNRQDAEMEADMDWTNEEYRKRAREMEDNYNKRMARTVETARAYMEYVPEVSHFAHFAATQAVKKQERSRSPFDKKDVGGGSGKKEVKEEVKEERSRSPLDKKDLRGASDKKGVIVKDEPATGSSAEAKRVFGQGRSTSQQAPRQPGSRQQVPPSLPPPPPRGRGAKRASDRSANGSGSPMITGLQINRTKDMNFWEQQSARELRTQLTLRNPKGKNEWAFKTRDQLLDLFRQRTAGADW